MHVEQLKHNLKNILQAPWLPWGLVGATLVVASLLEILHPAWLGGSSTTGRIVVWTIGLLGAGIAYLIYRRYSNLLEQRQALQRQLAEAEQSVAQADRRLGVIFQINQSIAEASDENEVIEPVLRFLVELAGADAAAFVPFDEHGQPQTILSHGSLPFPVMEAWLERLALPEVRQRCENCELQAQPDKPADCPLLTGPFSSPLTLMCLPVRRGEREFGIMNLFLPEKRQVDERTFAYLQALLDATALGLEGVQIRRRELDALRQAQVLRQKTDLKALLSSLLENVHRTLEADIALMLVPRSVESQSKMDLFLGEISSQERPLMDGILQGVMVSAEPVMLGGVAGGSTSASGVRSILAAPLVASSGAVVGAILVGNRRTASFHARQLALLQTVAGQVALVVENASLMAELEYKTVIQERARLAREIHDGLAQTIGFLKLQAAQLRLRLDQGEIDRLRQNIELIYSTLSEAYQDARQSIDGLRISPAECGLSGWIGQTVSEFEELSGLQVELQNPELHASLPSEFHAQLIRIIQEALSNVRKHANASRVWVACSETPEDLLLEVRDDGNGFSPQDVATASRYGLRGMRERAELIGADFQVISRPQQGTIVRLRLPLKGYEEVRP
jgi:two-component system nitrate/nitrite sensor histidine kinase NarX